MAIHIQTAQIVDNALPRFKENGRFWENRQDRFHCGVDIYAPHKSPVYAIETGRIVSIHPFTSPLILAYWNNTIAVVLEGESGYLYKYAELESAEVDIGDCVQCGDNLGRVGRVLNVNHIDCRAPEYIQQLKENKHPSMLHFEVYKHRPYILDFYSGGNLFSDHKPEHLCDPAIVLNRQF